MKAILMMFDSLNMRLLSPYGCDWTKTPNFQRLADHSVMFMNNYAGSLPCIPARRELHTGRYNFLHRSWGPLEPFDDSMPEILKNNGIHSHLVSDHCHYWEDGGATYHNRYSTWEIIRGQEGDPWKVTPELMQGNVASQNRDAKFFFGASWQQKRDQVNRQFMDTEEAMPMAITFREGLDFLDRNGRMDKWFLQIECFDPHEPFFSPQEYKDLYPHDYDGPDIDWPPYHHVLEDEKTATHLKYQYAALLSMCDRYLGKLLDKMDELDLWKDTLLIVNTDHGYLLGEHGWWSKIVMPVYDEIGHTPLFIYDPRLGRCGEHRESLVQMIDIPATVLEYFSLPLPKDMQGKPLRSVIENDTPVRDYAMFGIHGAHVNVTDGRYVYMKAPVSEENQPLYDYTLMPTHMRSRFSVNELKDARLSEPMPFTKDCPVMQIPCACKSNSEDFSALLMDGGSSEASRHIDNNSLVNAANFGDKLFDLKEDPREEHSLLDTGLEVRMANLLVRAMRENDSPVEQFERLGLPKDGPVTQQHIERLHQIAAASLEPQLLPEREWTHSAVNTFRGLMKFVPKEKRPAARHTIEECLSKRPGKITGEQVLAVISTVIPEPYVEMVTYFVGLSGRVE